MTPAEFWERVYALDAAPTRDECGDFVFDYLDRCLLDGKTAYVDEVLAAADVARLSSSVVRSALVMTHAAKKNLKNYPAFYEKGLARVTELRGEIKARKLLWGLRP